MVGPDRPLVAVLDYGIGNLRSAEKGLQRVGADARLTDDAGLVRAAAGVVLPGVGAFGRCMEALRGAGLENLVHEVVAAGTPFLGICIGMQMLYEGSEESPEVTGTGVLSGEVRRLRGHVKLPQMQWNALEVKQEHPMVAGLDDGAFVYFVHSYAADDSERVVATCDYGGPVVAAVASGRVWATQFHPEKSGANGLRLLGNFVSSAAS